MEKGIIKTLRYFSQFEYAPTLSELRLFHPVPVAATIFRKKVEMLTKERVLVCITTPECQVRYTLGEYSMFLKKMAGRVTQSRRKLLRVQPYLRTLQKYEELLLVGVSGSVAMENADPGADIDLFIITRAGRLWTGRAIAMAAAAVMGIRRGRTTTKSCDKVCLNMFMDESDLVVPKVKQTEFVAHEILQMKPVFVRGSVYDRFLKENSWIYRYFPNAMTHEMLHFTPGVWSFLHPRGEMARQDNSIEKVAKRMQLFFINRHKTTEIVTDTQLWFFPDDVERTIKYTS